jgi:hypothetical protein
MKMNATILAVVLGTAFTAIAAPLPQDPSASNKEFKYVLPSKTNTASADTYKIERVGDMSSRPWSAIAARSPGTSQFPDAEKHQIKLVLLRIQF